MKKFWFLIVFMMPLTTGWAQGISFLFETSYSMYSMTSMKNWQEEYIRTSGFPAKVVDDFPSYYGYELSLAGQSNRSEYGIFGGYNSTGGRIDLQDYSGSFQSDQILHGLSYGVFYQYQINRSTIWKLYTSLHLSTVISTIDFNYSLRAGDIQYNGKEKLYAKSYGFRPGVQLRRELGAFLIYGAVNYELQSKGNIHSNEYNNQLRTMDGTKVYTQWGGLRLSLGVGFSIEKQK